MKNCVKIIAALMVVFMGAGYAEAYSPSDFVDLFNNPKLMWYCSQSASINGVAGVSGVCAGGLYYYSETLSGFREQNNPNDPKRLCQNDTGCTPMPQSMYMGGTYHSINAYDGKVPSLFRIYIPPGTTGIQMGLYVPQVRVATVVRMGQPPANPNKPVSEYYNIQSPGLLMSDVMNGGELWVKNGDGCILTFTGGGEINQSVLQSKGFSDRWLYIQVVNYDSAWLEKLNFGLTIGDMAAYRAWYNSVNWDCYNNPGTAACSSVPSYKVTFTADTGGTINGSTSTSQTVAQGSLITPVTALPDCNNNYRFVNWTILNSTTPISTTPTLSSQTVTADITYVAHFTQQQSQTTQHTVNTLRNPVEGGEVYPASQTVVQGGTATFIAKSGLGYKFDYWSGSCNPGQAIEVGTYSNVTANTTCTANFKKLTQYTIGSTDAEKGSVSVSSAYEGESVSAISKSGYRFVNWTGGVSSTENPLKLSTVSQTPISITANFASDSLKCNGDTKLGLEDVIYILQVLAGLRP